MRNAGQCGVCGYDGQLGSVDLGIEAAHVMWHMAGGPDSEDNGVALCTFHHKAFDRGALGLDDDRRILVSEEVRGGQAVEQWLLRFAGAPLRPPLPGRPHPAERFVRWHRKEVFRAPARAGLEAARQVDETAGSHPRPESVRRGRGHTHSAV